ncbi:putative nuclease HARBI1 [Eurosta solidaginis]|uniref:putative nuclease HARBI1 n=1 Tax=Eurosta solidaginis TaxID=178769 RepID=UPI0035307667
MVLWYRSVPDLYPAKDHHIDNTPQSLRGATLSLQQQQQQQDETVARRLLRDKSDPLALPQTAFLKQFRLSKEAFQFVLHALNLKQSDAKAVPPVLQLPATLSLLGSGGYQHCVGSDYLVGMSQSTVQKITSQVILEMENKLCPQYIQFPLNGTLECKQWFMDKYKIPGVIGCIDGTHIGLQRPSVDEHMYFNRRGYHSCCSFSLFFVLTI